LFATFRRKNGDEKVAGKVFSHVPFLGLVLPFAIASCLFQPNHNHWPDPKLNLQPCHCCTAAPAIRSRLHPSAPVRRRRTLRSPRLTRRTLRLPTATSRTHAPPRRLWHRR
jgi:hypothetical protein